MDDERTWYDVLGVEPRAAKGDIKVAYQDALDSATVAENPAEVAQVRRAWQVLSDPVQRQRYDEAMGLHLTALEPVTTNGDGHDDDDEYEDEDAVDVEVLDDDEPGAKGPRRPKPSIMETAAFLELPTLGRRTAAMIIDGLTFLAVSAAGGIALLAATGSGIPLLVWVELMVVGVYIFPTVRTGQTFGKRVTYLMVVDRASGDLLTTRQVVTRYIVQMAVIPLLFPLGPFIALYFGMSWVMGRDQVSLADRLAKSIVVIARYKPSRQPSGA
jgi:uncharacterized RDD family membrane protein YckC